MADESLNIPVIIQASRIDATLLPVGFPLPYQLYVIQNGIDFGSVANKANEAGNGAYDAQVKNYEQDIVLDDYGQRISNAESRLVNHEIRISEAEITLVGHGGRISTLEADVDYLQDAIIQLEDDVEDIKTDYVSKSASTDQNIQSGGGVFLIGGITTPTTDVLQIGGSSNALVSYKVAGLTVVGARRTGWTAAAGTAYRGAFNSDPTMPVSAVYKQSEVQAIANNLLATVRRLKALEDDIRAHGLINS